MRINIFEYNVNRIKAPRNMQVTRDSLTSVNYSWRWIFMIYIVHVHVCKNSHFTGGSTRGSLVWGFLILTCTVHVHVHGFPSWWWPRTPHYQKLCSLVNLGIQPERRIIGPKWGLFVLPLVTCMMCAYAYAHCKNNNIVILNSVWPLWRSCTHLSSSELFHLGIFNQSTWIRQEACENDLLKVFLWQCTCTCTCTWSCCYSKHFKVDLTESPCLRFCGQTPETAKKKSFKKTKCVIANS